MTLGCAGPRRPIVKPAPTFPTGIDPAPEKRHQEVQRPSSVETVDSAAPTLRADMGTLSSPQPHCRDVTEGSLLEDDAPERVRARRGPIPKSIGRRSTWKGRGLVMAKIVQIVISPLHNLG